MNYRLLGKSGLRVSEFCLGTMTFGEDWGWGSSKDEAKKIYDISFARRAATSLIPPIFTRMAQVSPFSASFLKDIARAWSSQRNLQTPLRERTQTQQAITARTWCRQS